MEDEDEHGKGIHKDGVKKNFACVIDVDFPHTKEDEIAILKRIERIVWNTQKSTIDWDFIRDIMVEENAEELSMFDVNTSAHFWKELPWDKVEFKAESLTRGSTILNFSLTFKQLPRNPGDICAYNVIELLIKTTIENLNFINRIEKNSSPVKDDNRIYLQARFEVDNDEFVEEKKKKV